jgi:hypothetical protein
MPTTKTSTNSILSKLKIKSLNEMQLASIDAIDKNNECTAIISYRVWQNIGLPVTADQIINPANTNTQAIIIVPSRELALQIESVFKSMGTDLKVTCCYGGHLRETEENNLKQPPGITYRYTRPVS